MSWRVVKGQIYLIAVFFILLVLISISGFTLPGPAAWLGDWVKLLGTVIAIVAGLKAAWSVPELLQALINRHR